MSSVNRVILVGRLARDPETKSIRGGANVVNMSVATSRKFKDGTGQYQETTEWHRIVAFGRQADYASQYLSKGRLVYIEGRLRTSTWQTKDGQKRSTTEVVAGSIQGLDRGGHVDRPSGDSGSFGNRGTAGVHRLADEAKVPQVGGATTGGLVFDDDDIPF